MILNSQQPIKAYIETLGCPKNIVSSEKIAGSLEVLGLKIIKNPNKADIIIINTCTFINDSRKEAIETIFSYVALKANNKDLLIIVTGCLFEMYKDELSKLMPEVDYILDVSNVADFIKTNIIKINEINKYPEYYRKTTQLPSSNYLKISDGCNRRCSFCSIPTFKGDYVSSSINTLVDEASFLMSKGIKELNLVAQDTTYYGNDLLDGTDLIKLLKALVKIDGLEWIRLLYLYPTEITDELIELVKNEEKICNYFDIPLQHLSDNVLKSMNRDGSYKDYQSLIDKIKNRISDVSLRSTFIVGFPGETSEDFELMKSRLDEMQFTYAGAFMYSDEENTDSFHLQNKIDKKIKKQRFNSFMDCQKGITEKLLTNRLDKKLKVLVEEKIKKSNLYICRSQYEAPDIDGRIVVEAKNIELEPGNFYHVIIKKTMEYDCYGELYE